MRVRLAFGWLYQTMTAGLDEDRLLELDAALGDPTAAAARQERRMENALALGIEVG